MQFVVLIFLKKQEQPQLLLEQPLREQQLFEHEHLEEQFLLKHKFIPSCNINYMFFLEKLLKNLCL